MAGIGKPRGPQKGTGQKEYKAARAAREQYEQAKSTPLGSGARAAAIEASARARGIKNPGAIVGIAGRAKYGPAKMAQLAAAGRRRKS